MVKRVGHLDTPPPPLGWGCDIRSGAGHEASARATHKMNPTIAGLVPIERLWEGPGQGRGGLPGYKQRERIGR